MPKFIFLTAPTQSGVYNAPQGQYSWEKGMPFTVTNPVDLEFFRQNHRFSEYGVLDRVVKAVKGNDPVPPDVDEFLSEELTSIGLFKKKEVKALVRKYGSASQLSAELEMGYRFEDVDFSDEQKDALLNKYLRGE